RLCPRRNNWTSKAGWRCKHWLKMQSSFAPQLCGGSCNSFCARSSGCRWCAMAVLLLRWGTSNAAASSVTCRITLWNVSAADSGGCVPSHFWVITDGPKWHTPSAIVLIHAVGRRCNKDETPQLCSPQLRHRDHRLRRRRWNVPGLTFADVEQRARKYVAENNVHLLEESLLNENNRLFVEGCRRLGYRVQQFPVNLKGCRGSSLCNLGCPNQAQQGTDRVQLPCAERNGVEVVTRCDVQRIEDKKIFARVSEKAEGNKGEPSTWEPGD